MVIELALAYLHSLQRIMQQFDLFLKISHVYSVRPPPSESQEVYSQQI